MTKEITQEERLDLKNLKEEKEAFAKCIEDKIKTLLKDTKGSVIIDTKDLYAENQRLKGQLKDYEKALKEYANEKNWNEDLGGNYNFHYVEKYRPKTFDGFLECVFDCPIAPIVYNSISLAQETLKKWGKENG